MLCCAIHLLYFLAQNSTTVALTSGYCSWELQHNLKVVYYLVSHHLKVLVVKGLVTDACTR